MGSGIQRSQFCARGVHCYRIAHCFQVFSIDRARKQSCKVKYIINSYLFFQFKFRIIGFLLSFSDLTFTYFPVMQSDALDVSQLEVGAHKPSHSFPKLNSSLSLSIFASPNLQIHLCSHLGSRAGGPRAQAGKLRQNMFQDSGWQGLQTSNMEMSTCPVTGIGVQGSKTNPRPSDWQSVVAVSVLSSFLAW